MPGWARDTFVYSTAAASPPGELCILNLAFFNAFMALVLVIELANLCVNTHSVLERARRRNQRLRWGQYQTILSSLCTLVVGVLFTILPHTHGTDYNVMLCLVGVVWCLFNVVALRWVSKIHRLGSKLIMKRVPEAKSTLQALGQDQTVFSVLLGLGYVLTAMQFLCTCVLAVVFYEDAGWVRASYGLNTAFLAIAAACALHQTEKCRQAVKQTIQQVAEMLTAGTLDKYAQVQAKFRNQELFFALVGVGSTLMCALAAAGVIPVDHRMLLVAMGLDAAGALLMSVSATTVSCGRRRPPNSKLSPVVVAEAEAVAVVVLATAAAAAADGDTPSQTKVYT